MNLKKIASLLLLKNYYFAAEHAWNGQEAYADTVYSNISIDIHRDVNPNSCTGLHILSS
jgi:hypothetical protein